jgi:hypothetical protein
MITLKQSCLPSTAVFFLCAAVALIAGSCRSTSAPPTAATESSKTEKSLPSESASAPQSTAPEEPPAAKNTENLVSARVFPESLIAAPARDLAPPRIEYNTVLRTRPIEAQQHNAWRYRATRQGQLVGFEFSNQGGNPILPPRRDAVRNQFYARDFQFRFDDRARQDIHLMISDWAPSRDRTFRLSELMNSLMMFFPRRLLPAIVNSPSRNIITLPTGEEVEFDAATHEIVAGVFAETPVDLNPDRLSRRFPGVHYHGKGVAIRADARGADPRLSATALITTGTPAKDCAKGILCSQCEVRPQDLWEQSGAARFKYATDADFDRFLTARCEFNLPSLAKDLASAGAAYHR